MDGIRIFGACDALVFLFWFGSSLKKGRRQGTKTAWEQNERYKGRNNTSCT